MKNKTSLLLLAMVILGQPLSAQTWRQKREASSGTKTERRIAQKDARDKRMHKRNVGPPFYMSNQIAVYATPLSILNPYGAVLPVGLTYYFAETFSVSADISIPLFFRIPEKAYPLKKIQSDLGFHANIKFYTKVKHSRRLFFGVEAVYRKQDFTVEYGSLHYKLNWYRTLDLLELHKQYFGLGAFFGFEFTLKPKWLLEGRVGMGFRQVTMQHNFDTTGIRPVYDKSYYAGIPTNEDQVGDRATTVYVPLGLTLKYLLN